MTLKSESEEQTEKENDISSTYFSSKKSGGTIEVRY